MAKMLEGIKVLDFTMNAAGPIIGAYFADYGADVVKIEPPGGEAYARLPDGYFLIAEKQEQIWSERGEKRGRKTKKETQNSLTKKIKNI